MSVALCESAEIAVTVDREKVREMPDFCCNHYFPFDSFSSFFPLLNLTRHPIKDKKLLADT